MQKKLFLFLSVIFFNFNIKAVTRGFTPELKTPLENDELKKILSNLNFPGFKGNIKVEISVVAGSEHVFRINLGGYELEFFFYSSDKFNLNSKVQKIVSILKTILTSGSLKQVKKSELEEDIKIVSDDYGTYSEDVFVKKTLWIK